MKIYYSDFYSGIVNIPDNTFWNIQYLPPKDKEELEGIVLFVGDKHIVLANGEHFGFDYEMSFDLWLKIEQLLSDVITKVYEIYSDDHNAIVNIPEIEKELFEQRKADWTEQGLLTVRDSNKKQKG